tara:strand:+ start:2171 stop:2527 length:357 start_codon:yes stop_codon:yes gene_type:complete
VSDLYTHLQTAFPEQTIIHLPKGHYDIFESTRFRMNVSVTGNWFRIHFLQARPQGQRYGDTLVSVLLSYCRKSGLVPLAVDPEQYENFWRRNDFEPTPDDDQLWVHEEWSEAYSGEFV